MRNLIFFCCISCFLFSCQSEEERAPENAIEEVAKQEENESTEVQDKAIPKQEDKEAKKPSFPYLTNENCVTFFTEYGKKHPQTRIKMTTPFGEIKLRLYEETPLHRANFIYLINRGYFDPVEMTRVVKDFVVQGGNSESPDPSMMRTLIGNYTLPPEFRWNRIHKKGAISLSRVYDEESNPDKRSSPYDFFLVDGAVPGTVGIYKAEENRGRKYTDAQVDIYKKMGGTIHLDQDHTVFGEITSGMAVLDKMAAVRVDDADWPRERLEITIELLED